MNSWLRKRVLVFTGTLCMYGTLMAGLKTRLNGSGFEMQVENLKLAWPIIESGS
jgi:hypothetical protein